jgi:hypothetical protein
MKQHWKIVAPALAALGMGAMIVTVAPAAQAGPQLQSCGVYQLSPAGAVGNPGTFVLAVRGTNCQQARAVMGDWDAGKGTKIARNASTVDGYECVGNPGGTYDETGELSYCKGNGAYFAVRKPLPGDL